MSDPLFELIQGSIEEVAEALPPAVLAAVLYDLADYYAEMAGLESE